MMMKQRGFSLPEVLVALLLLSLTVGGLLHYQRTIALSFHSQWQYQALWQSLWLRLQDEPVAGWSISLQKMPGPEGCELRQASTLWREKTYQLHWLVCPQSAR